MDKPSREGWIASPGKPLWPFMVFLVTGLACILLERAGLVIPARAARMLSPDGEISQNFLNVLARRQSNLGLALLLGSLACVMQITQGLRLEALLSRLGSKPNRLVAILSLAGGVIALLMQQWLFEGLPRVTDATCHDFQAKVFVSGRISAPLPSCPEAFYQHNMVMTRDGRWFSRYPPGTALLLAAGRAVGAPWLPMPLLHAVSISALYFLATRFFRPKTALLAAFFYALSPLALLLGASFMSHTPFMAMALSGLALFFKYRSHASQFGAGQTSWLMGGGFCFGCTILLRPQDSAIVLAMAAVCLVWINRDQWPDLIRRLPWAVLGAVPCLGLFLWYNSQVHGTPWSTGYGFGNDQALHPGITVSLGFSERYDADDALRNTLFTAYKFNQALLGWPISLALIPLAFLQAGTFRRQAACLTAILPPVVFFFFYSYPAYEYEARFWILMAPPCMILSAEGLLALWRRSTGQIIAMSLLISMYSYALADYWPKTLLPAYGQDYEQVTGALENSARKNTSPPALVLIDATGENEFRYSAGFVFNDPDLSRSIIYARDGDSSWRACLLEAYKTRNIYRYRPGDPWANGTFEMIHPAALTQPDQF